MSLILSPHPETPCAAVSRLEVNLARAAPASLALRYLVSGDIAALTLPPAVERGRADELWTTTCFEAFLRIGQGSGYVELNLSPSNRWAAYRFDGYRQGMAGEAGVILRHLTQRACARQYELVATLDLAGVAGLDPGAPWRLAVSAVIETAVGGKSYFALAHPPGKPDFHHPDAFAFDLPAAEQA